MNADKTWHGRKEKRADGRGLLEIKALESS
jgi:hypothetical protein